jgi:ATP-binding cassette subfamily B protein
MNARRLFVPEVIQASGMDCGPASLKSLLEGFGIHASYGRLREACQTDVDGTSIDTIEEIARRLGLDAEQIMLPADHVLLPEAKALPAIAVVCLPNGVTHFLVIWRRQGPMLQLMDPAGGRRWVNARKFLADLYQHRTAVPAEAWREWADSDVFRDTLTSRLRRLGIPAERVVRNALSDPGWQGPAVADAAVRFAGALIESGGIRRGRQAARLLDRLLASGQSIPDEYWSVRPDGEDGLLLRGAVLVAIRGKLARSAGAGDSLPPELSAALEEKPAGPGRELLRLMRADGALAPAVLAGALLLAAAGVALEAVLFRSLLDIGAELGLAGQRFAAIAAITGLTLLLGLLEFSTTSSLLRIGRRIETRLRVAFLEKIPRLGDRYFQSRLKSDMTERSHMIHRIRRLPELGGRLLRNVFELLLTAAGIAWLDPAGAPWAAAAAACAVILPLAAQPALTERDLRVRSHMGALCRFYLDAFLGLVPIRVHGAGQAVRREQGNLLVEWASAGFGLQRLAAWVEAMQFAAGFGLAAWLVTTHLARNGEGGGVLLLVYWALNLPVLGQEIASIAWQYPAYRNMTLRVMEPLGALEDADSQGEPAARAVSHAPTHPAAAIRMEHISVRAAGHLILDDLDLDIPAGAHVGIVGPSGAGKSSLAGTLLGWWKPSDGRILLDGEPLDGRIDQLRRATAWVDPEVHLWNRTILENLRYGAVNGGGRPVGEVVDAAELRRVLEKLPGGFEAPLGGGGALVSGGEGQRVRLGRALFREQTRLVILDEPFRGLERENRRRLLRRARELWKDATLLCITHDVAETMVFDRVLVVEGGRIVEDGDPTELAAKADSRYASMIRAEAGLRETAWSGAGWRRLRVENGTVRSAEAVREVAQ